MRNTLSGAMFALRPLIAALCRRTGSAAAGPYERGLAALGAGRCEEALRHFAAAPSTASVCNKRGVALIALERRAEALDAFYEAFAHDERYAPALTNIGNLLLEEGADRDAVDHYRAALAADRTYPGAHRNLGVALRRAGRRGPAVRAWRAAARLEGRRAGGRG